jgi:hypothetical protein
MVKTHQTTLTIKRPLFSLSGSIKLKYIHWNTNREETRFTILCYSQEIAMPYKLTVKNFAEMLTFEVTNSKFIQGA